MDTSSPEPFGSDTMHALVLANTEALASWMALCREAWMRAASVRNPLEYAAIGSLMLPACASQTMLYCKRISDIATGARAAAGVHDTAHETGTPAAAIELSANASPGPAVMDSAGVARAPKPSSSGAVKRSIPAPRFRGE